MLKRYLTTEFIFFLTGFLIFIYRSLFTYNAFNIIFLYTWAIDSVQLTIILMTLFGFLALPYLLLRINGTPMYRIMGWIHYFLTILPWFVYEVIMHPDHGVMSAGWENHYMISFIAAFLFMTGQLIFFMNIIMTLFKRRMES